MTKLSEKLVAAAREAKILEQANARQALVVDKQLATIARQSELIAEISSPESGAWRTKRWAAEDLLPERIGPAPEGIPIGESLPDAYLLSDNEHRAAKVSHDANRMPLRLDHKWGGRGTHGDKPVTLYGDEAFILAPDQASGEEMISLGGDSHRQHSGHLQFVGFAFGAAFRCVGIYASSNPLYGIRFQDCRFSESTPPYTHDRHQIIQAHGCLPFLDGCSVHQPGAREHFVYPHNTPGGVGGMRDCTILGLGGQIWQQAEEMESESKSLPSDVVFVDVVSINGHHRSDKRAGFAYTFRGGGDRIAMIRCDTIDTVEDNTRRKDGSMTGHNYGGIVTFDGGGHQNDNGRVNESLLIADSVFVISQGDKPVAQFDSLETLDIQDSVFLTDNGQPIRIYPNVGSVNMEGVNRPEHVAIVREKYGLGPEFKPCPIHDLRTA